MILVSFKREAEESMLTANCVKKTKTSLYSSSTAK